MYISGTWIHETIKRRINFRVYFTFVQKLFGAFQTKCMRSNDWSRSVMFQEEKAEFAAPQNAMDAVNKVIEAFEDVPELDEKRHSKRIMTIGTKHPKTMETNIEKGSGDKGKGPKKSLVRVGNHSVKQLTNIMSEIPTDEDWTRMEESGLNSVVQRVAEHWGHLGSYMSGAISITFEDLKRANAEIKEKEDHVNELISELGELKTQYTTKESSMQIKLKEEGDRADKAEKESTDLRSELFVLKKKLYEEKHEEAIIAEFKKSSEYGRAIADDVALDILRSWIVAEKDIKTNVNANSDSFVEEFLAAKTAIEQGKGEPTPFDGQSPSFLPALTKFR
ncbi:uncharacterized protein LOC141670763 isoform X2 [Apium graveolens]|uniref:uncharacterized protein LOC141670763 isoform X2 n=1 Tax=Apium graveolens TaxID=4045 RepID=UPI003D7BBFCD